ncbi:MAG: hypothetical protein LBQ31_06990 [Bacteroidales bacterium]|nr:hypothetical protein [Bacteroidales bacterium]
MRRNRNYYRLVFTVFAEKTINWGDMLRNLALEKTALLIITRIDKS